MTQDTPEIGSSLTEREILIAKAAARYALQEMSDTFYKSVGKSLIQRIFLWVLAFLVGIGWSKGWITFGPPP